MYTNYKFTITDWGGLYCQTLATGGAAAREDEPTLVGSHAGTETMYSYSFFLFWLVGLFHGMDYKR